MKHPPFLKPGDTIAITCPSGYMPTERIAFAKKALEKWGYKVIVGQTIGSAHFYFSERDEVRRDELQAFLDHKVVKAILMGRGGYGLSRIIDDLDFSHFKKQPKWICGFSDITMLHSHIHARYRIPTLHSPMCGAFQNENEALPHLQSLHNAWTDVPIHYPVSPNPNNKKGKASGILVGGNLAILAHLSGSASQMNTEGKILFLEDVGEYLYNIDRMLYTLKRSGMLRNLAALVCGGFTELKDTERPFGQEIHELILDKVKDQDYPVCFDIPAGHQDINYTLLLGKYYDLEVTTHKVTFNHSINQ